MVSVEMMTPLDDVSLCHDDIITIVTLASWDETPTKRCDIAELSTALGIMSGRQQKSNVDIYNEDVYPEMRSS